MEALRDVSCIIIRPTPPPPASWLLLLNVSDVLLKTKILIFICDQIGSVQFTDGINVE